MHNNKYIVHSVLKLTDIMKIKCKDRKVHPTS